ncbi:hypothetical protein PHYBLDRAFT_173574 [Phycomyces blakesleeanus NRRL 1555(-)]|uniref:Uncharacterized protein n=1 Tax=Phycomyces blakesleeanus (strain ATCC 8743b / DSM 1359 / FGSC 10004 / NBRC 33097 / NRRL 1555) TaxID=763407 RepID=A0A162ZNP8_PHYB8|nr:hypothetical protein PHYBLDRAFT_173574 [Phycomyces blakesleeanus NRRL 1555(-)]OAD68081.1 hypothetical protein PHYBLDRAFT_173574 [Phycomyces blakesleeanus NRRL 1555(-)]|eukprot:XP_018286121.1 hypothetical protein PHYBLDRAFT_173574 [Phycomyces blakesleeanus NRRL 1555(-)]
MTSTKSCQMRLRQKVHRTGQVMTWSILMSEKPILIVECFLAISYVWLNRTIKKKCGECECECEYDAMRRSYLILRQQQQERRFRGRFHRSRDQENSVTKYKVTIQADDAGISILKQTPDITQVPTYRSCHHRLRRDLLPLLFLTKTPRAKSGSFTPLATLEEGIRLENLRINDIRILL